MTAVTFDPASMSDLLREVIATRPPQLYGRCIYCGHPCYGVSCRHHRDLLFLDPNQSEMRLSRPTQE